MVLNMQRGINARGRMIGRGVGDITTYINGDLTTLSDTPCAPGLSLINGSCFRAPGTQSTPYGDVSAVIAGPDSNNLTASQILGGGAICKLENVTSGPYSVPQNVCRDAAGNYLGGADLIAEHAYVQGQLATWGQPVTVRPATTPQLAASNPTPSTIRPTSPTPAPGTPSATLPIPSNSPAGAAGGELFSIPGWESMSSLSSLPWGWIAAGVGALFLIPKMSGAGAR
jgi:hypothetical protein